MQHSLPDLPYALDALEPHISSETLEYHHGKHHKTYVDNLNKLIEGTEFADKTLEEIIKTSSAGIFNNAAQIWNHTFYFKCLSPKTTSMTKDLEEVINSNFGSFENFKDDFTKTAVTTFGSGWAWLVQKSDGKLAILSTSNAETPLTEDCKILLTCDVWEHAYYIDHRNARPSYLKSFWELVNWEFVSSNFNK